MDTLDLPAIQDAIFGGDRQALDRLYRIYNPVVFATIEAQARTMPRLGAYTSELTSEVWLRLLDSNRRLLRSYSAHRGSFHRFIEQVAIDTAARATASTQLCEHQCVVPNANPDRSFDRGRPLEQWLEDADYVQQLLGAIEQHGAPSDRLMLECMEVYGMSAGEVARRLTVSRDAIYIRKCRLKKSILPTCVAQLADADHDTQPTTYASSWNDESAGRSGGHRLDGPTTRSRPVASLVTPRRQTRPQQSAYNAGHVPPDPPNPARPRAGYRLRQRQSRSPQG